MSHQSSNSNSREIVLSMLQQTVDQGAFSHLVLNRAFEKYSLSRRDQVFAARLFHGVLEQIFFLDWIISSYSSVKIKKMNPVVCHILRMSIYQMLFMESVPDRAAINEAVELTKKRGLKGLSPFVNGVLRNFQRGGIKPGMPEHVKHNLPLWLYDRLLKELGKGKTHRFCDAVSTPEEFFYARMLTSRAPAEDIIRMLERDGCKAERVPDTEEALRIYQAGSLKELDAYRQGLILVQDLSSMQVGKKAAELIPAEEVHRIVDVCAAPGGKSLHLAEKYPHANVLSRDLSEEKIRRIEENIQKCGAGNVTCEVFDARVYDESLAEGADIVLADLPCSGIGVIGQKPDIRLRIREDDLRDLAELQAEILSTVSGYVRKGGLLIYSTCTVSRQENEENARRFEQGFPFEKIYERQYLPGEDPCDGFYLACFRRNTDR